MEDERVPAPPVRMASQKGPNETGQGGGSKPLPLAPIQDEKKKKGLKIFSQGKRMWRNILGLSGLFIFTTDSILSVIIIQ